MSNILKRIREFLTNAFKVGPENCCQTGCPGCEYYIKKENNEKD